MDHQTEYTLDKNTIDNLSSDTRVRILVSLRERKKTNAELSRELALQPSTLHYHLEKLRESGLVDSLDNGHKWIYYHLTPFGEALIVQDKNNRWFIILSAILTFVTGFASLYTYYSLPRLDIAPRFPSGEDPVLVLFLIIIPAMTLEAAILLIYLWKKHPAK